jgi:two-component system, NarL family, sensor histidine kinase BarA
VISAADQPPALAKLIDLDAFREVCRSLSELYGIGVRIFDLEGKKLVDVRVSTADHCGYLFTVHPTKVMCTNLVNEIRTCPVSVNPKELAEFNCFSGLRYKVMPIVHEGEVLGRVIFGPFAPSTLEYPPSKLKVYEPDGLSLETLAGYQRSIPRASEEAVERVLESVRNILDVIIHTGYKSYLTSQMHITSITGAFDDLKSSNKTLQEANQRLQELDRLKSNFIATVSHELRTPLTSVIGYSEMLLEGMAGPISDEQKNYVRTILEKGESLLALIGQVLDLSRIESGNSELRMEPTDPREVIRICVSDVVPQAQKRNLEVKVDVAEDVDVIIVDRDKIRRIITNLLGNAVKFTPAGGKVEVRARITEAPPQAEDYDIFEPERNRYLSVQVEDTGIGIPDDKLGRIFDSFFQVDNSSTREFGGSGLGLSIAKNFATAHKGKLEVKSALGKGSCFTLLLPYHPRRPAPAVGVDGLGGKAN